MFTYSPHWREKKTHFQVIWKNSFSILGEIVYRRCYVRTQLFGEWSAHQFHAPLSEKDAKNVFVWQINCTGGGERGREMKKTNEQDENDKRKKHECFLMEYLTGNDWQQPSQRSHHVSKVHTKKREAL